MNFEREFSDFSLVAAKPDHAAQLPELFADPRIISNLVGAPYPFTEKHIDESLELWRKTAETGMHSIIEVNGELAGDVGIRSQDGRLGKFGCWLAPKFRGRGIMRRAVREMAKYAFSEGDFERLEWFAAVGNWESRRVAWSVGFKFDAVLKSYTEASAYQKWLNPQAPRLDYWCLSLLRGEKLEPAEAWCGPLPGQEVGVELPDFTRPDQLVRQFHEVYECPINTTPTLEISRLGMRMDLIMEEACELVGAVYGMEARRLMTAAWEQSKKVDDHTRDLVETADALADLIYVIYGMALEIGVDLPAVLSQVQASNMSKLAADGSVIKRADGKVLKGPNFFPPQIAQILGINDAS